ncbi:hypothetical protein FPOA_00088 [Fusarium poae]|uniref:Uncharacterized protein n=1 Tax=Fusarium poae TaxID=36050 RepID=A0A1B8B072_FUSPO|nr:hypothetical protein FPOA_00088 [Fusarium poae]
MKFSILAQALIAIPALASAIPEPVEVAQVDKRANCKFTIQWKSNWYENALRRYRVQLITEPRNDDHLDLYCGILAKYTVQLENQQCYWRDGMYVVDISEAQGPAGHDQYKRQHRITSERFKSGTGCDIVLNT